MDLNIPGLEDMVEVGRGGFATVYRAYQPAFRRTVAVKVLNAKDLDDLAQERFQRECQAMGLLSEHPSIVTVLDAGFLATGEPYMVMPFMPAGSLADRIREDGPMPWADASRVAVKLAGALHAAHDAGVIHRDVKPANILVSEYGEPKLADFGIARVAGGTETQSGVVTASLAYAPPEVIEGHRPTIQSDLYSLAATVYDLLAGHAPFEIGDDTSVAAILNRILHTDPPELVTRGVPEPLAEVLRGAMAKQPADRPATAEAFGRQIRLAQDELGIRPTELTILRVDTQPQAAGVASPEAPTEADPHLHPEEPETVGVTAAAPPHAPADDAEATRDAPLPEDFVPEPRAAVAATDAETDREEHAAAPPPDNAVDDDEAASRRRPLLIAVVVAVIAAAVLAVVALTGDDGDDPVPAADADDDPTVTIAAGDPDDAGTGGPMPEPPAGDPTLVTTPDVKSPSDVCPDGLTRPDEVDLSGRDLVNADLECLDLSGGSLRDARLAGAHLIGVDLTGADLTGAAFETSEDGNGRPAYMEAVDLTDARLDGLVFHGEMRFMDLTGRDFAGMNLDLQLTGSIANDVSFSGTTSPNPGELTAVNLSGVEAQRADFTGTQTNAHSSDLRDSAWGGGVVGGVTDSDLRGADLRGVTFVGDQQFVDLRDADLTDAVFTTVVSGVDLTGADLTGAAVENPNDWSDVTCGDGSTLGDNLGRCPFMS